MGRGARNLTPCHVVSQQSLTSLPIAFAGTECIYDPNSDHRRKGVYKNDTNDLKTRNSTLHTLIQALLNSSEDDAFELVKEIRTCESLDDVADRILAKENGADMEDEDDASVYENGGSQGRTFENQLYGKMGDLRLDEGSVRCRCTIDRSLSAR